MIREESKSRPVRVLLVEDNQTDVVLTRESLRQTELTVDLHSVENGEECMAFLRREGKYTEAPTPDLILLDLNMPVMDGREVMAQIVADETLKHLPVVVLTTSSSKQDILSMYSLRCNSFITKPVDFDDFLQVVRRLSAYWFGTVALPPAMRNRDDDPP